MTTRAIGSPEFESMISREPTEAFEMNKNTALFARDTSTYYARSFFPFIELTWQKLISGGIE